ncbi:DoxX family protein [Rhodopirellula sp. JC740]|uniref:DoxX family protein n=1 Tax=Rhodopirellula halodulae TaxID=2894198 RepID=A0ABS8NNY3_9BACT|nr:DoxX family protein [Rhodopirellula sp. JC740]
MAKFLLSPLRLAVGWGLSPRLLGTIAVVMLTLLRLTIGFHFITEGVDKYKAGNWSAKPFFANAKGPFAGHFRQMVWDYDGTMRLDLEQTKVVWAVYRDRIGEHFGFDEKQKAAAQNNYAKAVQQYEYVIELNANDIEEFELGLGRVDDLDADSVAGGVSSLSGQREAVRKELAQKIGPVFSQIDAIWENYETAQNKLATPEQQSRYLAYELVRPRLQMMDTSVIDRLVPYFDMAVGWCLLLGLFTPVAALAAAGFLGSVFLSQYPPETGPTSSNYQLIECMACFVLAATGAGRFAGLDFFLHLIIRKFCGNDAATA